MRGRIAQAAEAEDPEESMTQANHLLWIVFSSFGIAAVASCTHSSEPAPGPLAETDGLSSAVRYKQFLKPTSGIRGIFEDKQGNLWFNSPDWTCKFDPSERDTESGGYTYYSQDTPGIVVGSLQEDSAGRVWMQNGDGIHLYDGKEFTAITNRNYEAKHEWAKSKGDVWFGLDAGLSFSEAEGQWGVYRYHDGECTFLAFPEPPAGERARFYPLTSPAMQAKNGTVWFGTFNAAFGFDGESFDIIGRERMGLLNDERHIGIRGYHLDSKDRLWMADNGAGVFVYDGEKVVHFTALHGLEAGDVEGNTLHRSFSIAEDADGSIWIGAAYSGIWRYQPSEDDPIGKGTFTNYDDAQGWPCENAWTIYTTRDGELLFAGEEPGGVYRFNGEGFERAY
jgi:hypothetical protein